MKNKTVSLIIPTYNKPERLRITLVSVLNLALDFPLEVVIVNDGSTNETAEILKTFEKDRKRHAYLTAKIYHTANAGRSSARNYGICNSSGEILIFIDDDLVLHQDFVINHLKYHVDKNIVVHGQIFSLPYLKFFKDPVNGTLINEQKNLGALENALLDLYNIKNNIYESVYRTSRLNKFEKDIKNLYSCTVPEESDVRWIGFVGGNVSVEKQNILKAGMFDPMLGHQWGCEDLELGYRLYKEGMTFVYSESAANYHMDHYRENINKLHEDAFKYFLMKHHDISLEVLYDYFSGKLCDLIQWRNIIKT